MKPERIANATKFEAVWPLLTQAMGYSDAESYHRWRERYLTLPYQLWAFEVDNRVVGVLGLCLAEPAEITHIAVNPDIRGRGYGRDMVRMVQTLHQAVTQWVAETDEDAVGFYRRLGFSTERLPPRYPGVTR